MESRTQAIIMRSGMSNKKLEPVHPGEVLFEEFLKPLGLSQHRLALDIGVDATRINGIVLKKRSVSANMALKGDFEGFGASGVFGVIAGFFSGIWRMTSDPSRQLA